MLTKTWSEPIVRIATNFQRFSIPARTKNYGVHLHPILFPPASVMLRKDHENFLFDKKLMCAVGALDGFNYTALSPQLVTGPTTGCVERRSANRCSMRQSGVRRVNRSAFRRPLVRLGSRRRRHCRDVLVWAAQSPRRRTRGAFNITTATCSSGEKCGQPSPELLGVENWAGHADSVASLPEGKCGYRDRNRHEYGLRSQEACGSLRPKAPACRLSHRLWRPRRTSAFVSTVKAAPSGFPKTIDTEGAFRNALQSCSITHSCRPPRNNQGQR